MLHATCNVTTQFPENEVICQMETTNKRRDSFSLTPDGCHVV